MNAPEILGRAEDQLDRVLGFFPRVESKAATLFALDAGLLGLMALNLHAQDLKVWYIMLPASVAAALIAASLWFIYQCISPHLDGGGGSLIYFREISKLSENKYTDEYIAASHDAYLKDLLGQVWRNSDILRRKFDYVKWAFICAAFALVPWAVFLASTAVTHAQMPVVK